MISILYMTQYLKVWGIKEAIFAANTEYIISETRGS